MTFHWAKQLIATAVLCALVLLRLVDLMVFDAEHEHIERSHVQVHASEMSHAHHEDEVTEHETPATMSAHIGFHTLLGSFIGSPDVSIPSISKVSSDYGLLVNKSAVTLNAAPPVPPPLA